MPYGRFVQVREHPTDPQELEQLIRDFGQANRHLARGRPTGKGKRRESSWSKKDRAAWFVSNCESKSQRENYVAALAKHYPVDIYGACGNMV